MISLVVCLVLFCALVAADLEARPLDNIQPMKDKDVKKLLDKFEAAMKKAAEAAQVDVDYKRRHHEDPHYHRSDAPSYGGDDALRHERRTPIFTMAMSEGQSISDSFKSNMQKQTKSICKNRKGEDNSLCARAVACVMVHSITEHWDKLHLNSETCQKVINQFVGESRNTHAFDPEDKKDLLKAAEKGQASLIKLGEGRQKYRLACEKHDFKCNQKMDCYLSAVLADSFKAHMKLVRCPYGGWKRSSTSESEDEMTDDADTDKLEAVDDADVDAVADPDAAAPVADDEEAAEADADAAERK